MSLEADTQKEIEILRGKLTETEDRLVLAHKALSETDMKIHIVMKRLLTANDVKGDRAMRVNILEQMNDLQREVIGFFANVGITIDKNG
jgi:hypothetical protein